MSDQQIFTREEAAKYLRVSLSSIERAIKSGKLRAKRTSRDNKGNGSGPYRINRAALDAYFDGLADA